MPDKPIIFSAPMIRALLDGTKTQTRRIVKFAELLRDRKPTGELVNYYGDHRIGMAFEGTTLVQPLPIAPGDRLWAKETFQTGIWRGQEPQVTYRATMEWPWDGPWRSPIFMPRKLSRLTLTVTDVRVQRVQEITLGDCWAEGCSTGRDLCGAQSIPQGAILPFKEFRTLWNSLHGPEAWDANPWVAAYTFTVHRCNIDQMGG
jgi:hypothetical protein